MKFGFYRKLAVSGMSKNRKIYLPYLLTCIGMSAVFYIIGYLSKSSVIGSMRGGEALQLILSFGKSVTGFFAVIFLFYTNSFLMKRRTREFGLYNILGMNKQNLAKILLWENLLLYVGTMFGGLFCGILFSKAAELRMVHILEGDVSFLLYVEVSEITDVFLLFGFVFCVLLCYSLMKLHVSKPVELLKSVQVGEKPPKAKWLFAVLGGVLLSGGYYLASAVEDPIQALLLFFIAVLLVIAATYLLFITGSVAFCQLLKRKKSYYYKTSHFISVSSMVYRMKRNGAGLASICILSTMVLVIVSTTTCLFVGLEDAVRKKCPRDIMINFSTEDEAMRKSIKQAADDTVALYQLEKQETIDYKYIYTSGFLMGESFFVQPNYDYTFFSDNGGYSYADYIDLYVMYLDDYNQLTGQNLELQENEVIFLGDERKGTMSFLTLEGFASYAVSPVKDKMPNVFRYSSVGYPVDLLVMKDLETVKAFAEAIPDIAAEKLQFASPIQLHEIYGFDLDAKLETESNVRDTLGSQLAPFYEINNDIISYFQIYCYASSYENSLGTYGGLLFLGVLLSVVFLFAAVLIMYYKQISEGYEDQARFSILMKVGMTEREIKRSINSQVLTVFFLPLAAAGLHLIFAFHMVKLLMLAMGLVDMGLFVRVTMVSFAVFSVIYAGVYFITSKSYYHIIARA